MIDGYDKWLDSYSEEIRNILDIPDLYVFNCDCSRKIILCSCEFEFGGKQYYYKTDDKSIEIGDNVEVPVGEHGRTKIVKVVNIESATEDDLPYEYREIKSIIGLARPDDSYNSGEKYSLYLIVKNMLMKLTAKIFWNSVLLMMNMIMNQELFLRCFAPIWMYTKFLRLLRM